MTELIRAEVRLYFNGRQDYDTEYFTATCPIDLYNKAKEIASKYKAVHFNCSAASNEEEHSVKPTHKTRLIAGPSVMKDQIAAIEAAIGKGKSVFDVDF